MAFGAKNGELLTLLTESGFDVFVTVDRNIKYQQNIVALSLIVVVLCGPDNRRDTLKKLVPMALAQLTPSHYGAFIEIE